MTTKYPDNTTVVLTDDGNITVNTNGTVVFRGQPPLCNFYLGVYDIAELLRIAAGSDAAALEKLAYVMANGHRFRWNDDGPDRTIIDNEEPFQ